MVRVLTSLATSRGPVSCTLVVCPVFGQTTSGGTGKTHRTAHLLGAASCRFNEFTIQGCNGLNQVRQSRCLTPVSIVFVPTQSPLTGRVLPSNQEICRYSIGKVIGAGSFGVVRQVTEKATGRKFACKTISKVPKRGSCTPRYLLKIQTEVDVMQQLGASLDSVSLKASPASLSNLSKLICGL